ncbi:claudin-18 [Misgurnus anguillicaudatus]|uniref:claudin-18 n=1 Tax=Misgurnus anguillicaudatus TaxID=75329 RepID=UPI003CCF998F
MASTMLQYGGFSSGLIGLALVFAATVMDNWCVKDRQGDMITSVYTYKGLWRNCEVSNAAFTECRPLHGLAGYSGHFQTVRALMIMAIVISVAAVLIALFSLKCVKRRSMDQCIKAKMTLCAGILLIVAGLFGISGPSVYANDIVASFMMTSYYPNQGKIGVMGQYGDEIGKSGIGIGGLGMGGMDMLAPRYTFGPALYLAWVGGALLLLGGILMCIAFRGMQTNNDTEKGHVYKAPGRCRPADEEVEHQRTKGCQKY